LVKEDATYFLQKVEEVREIVERFLNGKKTGKIPTTFTTGEGFEPLNVPDKT
jgi:hypothetical protein